MFKSGDRNCVLNYRPICILCNFSKVFEMIIADIIWSYFSPSLCLNQHGFVPRRSTASNLFTFLNKIENYLLYNKQVDVIFTDISKAFDCVSHKIIIEKLKNLGIPDKIFKLVNSYLCNRRMTVVYKDTLLFNLYLPLEFLRDQILYQCFL